MTDMLESGFPEWKIRKMMKDDIDVCTKIMLTYEPYKSHDSDSARSICINPNWEHYVILFKQEIVGLVNSDTIKTFPDGITIRDIYVREDFKRKRVGTRLVYFLEVKCRMSKIPFLYATGVQENARGFFHRLGFEIVSSQGKDVSLCYKKRVEV